MRVLECWWFEFLTGRVVECQSFRVIGALGEFESLIFRGCECYLWIARVLDCWSVRVSQR